jgi:hypothetical protein
MLEICGGSECSIKLMKSASRLFHCIDINYHTPGHVPEEVNLCRSRKRSNNVTLTVTHRVRGVCNLC